jgi:putative transposase
MPWKEHRAVDLKKEFVLAASAPGANVAELCRAHGVSRKTGYKWLKRFKAYGLEGLQARSRRPKTIAGTDGEIVVRIVELRDQYPKWGAKKIHELLRREGLNAPAVKTIARILDRLGAPRVRRPSRRLRVVVRDHQPLVVKAPNDVWTVDFKGWWRTRDGKRFEPLTVRDAYSRFVLCLQMLGSMRAEVVKPIFQRLFEKYGLPTVIRVDNGAPFACTSAPAGLSRLSAWWTSLGIRVSFSRPAHPQDNGAHERMHADVAAQLEADPSDNLTVQQLAADRWRKEFNEVRPHESLQMKTPAEVYFRSTRSYLGIRPPRYPAHQVVRRVNRMGCVHYQGKTIFISASLAGFDIAVRRWGTRLAVRFYEISLGFFDFALAPLHRPPRLISLADLPKKKPAYSP